jgi:hypothetical protein
MAAQRYPNDYNGIVAGAPAAHFQTQNSLYHGWSVESNSTTGDNTGNVVLYADKAKVLHKAVVAACGGTSGAPTAWPIRVCNFNPVSIQCAAGATDTSNCLTAAEVTTASRSTAARRYDHGKRMLAGSPQPGRRQTGSAWKCRARTRPTRRAGDEPVQQHDRDGCLQPDLHGLADHAEHQHVRLHDATSTPTTCRPTIR